MQMSSCLHYIWYLSYTDCWFAVWGFCLFFRVGVSQIFLYNEQRRSKDDPRNRLTCSHFPNRVGPSTLSPRPVGTVSSSQVTLMKQLHGHAVQFLLRLTPELHQGKEVQQQWQVPRGYGEQEPAAQRAKPRPPKGRIPACHKQSQVRALGSHFFSGGTADTGCQL